MIEKYLKASAVLAALIATGSVNAQYNPTGSVTNQQPNRPTINRDHAYRDSTIAGGTGVSLPSASTPMPDICVKFPALKACQPTSPSPPTGGGGGAGQPPPKYALVGRCGLQVKTPSGATILQLGPGFGDRSCNSESLVWNTTTSGTIGLVFEVGDTGTTGATGGYYATWEETSSQDWNFDWTGICAGIKLQRCYPTFGTAAVGTRVNEAVTVTVTHKTSGEKHVLNYKMNLYICGAIVKNQKYGCA